MDDKQHTSSSDDERAEIATSNQDQETNSSKRVHLKRWQFISILIGTILITAVITVVAYIFINQKISGLNKTDQANLNKIENVYKILNSDYYKKQDSDKLSKAAIDGMVKELKDPYSEYLTKEQTKSFNEGVSGDFVGIGAEMQKKNDQIMVTSPMKGSPAERAGIRPKDVITKVNGKSIKGKALDEVVKDVRGKENTEVTLTVQRGSEEKDVKIKREKIHVKSVEYKKKGKVGVITINKFQNDTSGELKDAVLKAHKDGLKKIVLDLRNNPGGLLDEAVKMANIFIDKGKTVVKLEKGKDTEAIQTSNDALKEAKELMKEHDNEQWDDQYPLLEHFEEDIAKDYLYVLEENDKIYGFIVVDQDQAEWYDDIDWPVNREGAFVIHRLTGSKEYKGAATELFNYVIDVVKARGAEVILTDTFALNKPAQGLFAKFGFHKVGEQLMEYPPYDKGEPFYAYYKNLKE